MIMTQQTLIRVKPNRRDGRAKASPEVADWWFEKMKRDSKQVTTKQKGK